MRDLATWGLVTMTGVGVLSILMARYENGILNFIGFLLMGGLIAGGLWYMANTIDSTFF